MRRQACSSSGPFRDSGCTRSLRLPISIHTLSGFLDMLWYQAGCTAAPPNDATISQALSPSGTQPRGTVCSRPDLAPTVVKRSRWMPLKGVGLAPRSRMKPAMRARAAFDSGRGSLGTFTPRVPLGVISTGILVSFRGGLTRGLPVYRTDDAHRLDLNLDPLLPSHHSLVGPAQIAHGEAVDVLVGAFGGGFHEPSLHLGEAEHVV